jgi:hypothetical protein
MGQRVKARAKANEIHQWSKLHSSFPFHQNFHQNVLQEPSTAHLSRVASSTIQSSKSIADSSAKSVTESDTKPVTMPVTDELF